MKPQEPIPHNYSIKRLNLIFALSSLLLLGVTGAIVLYDYVRGWKWFQIEFMRIQHERIQQELQAANDGELRKQLAALDKERREGQVEIAKDRRQYIAAQKDLEAWEGRYYAADQDYRFAKALLDAKRYELETSVHHKKADAKTKQREFDELADRVQRTTLTLQQVTRDRDASKARLDRWLGVINKIEDRRKELTASIELLEKQLASVSATTPNVVLNMPMLDFVNPTLKIDQVVLNDMFIDMNYMSVPRVDRCQTCHRAIDRPGFESKKEATRLIDELSLQLERNQIVGDKRPEAEARIEQLTRIKNAKKEIFNPWRTHPRLDVFVGSASPHPLLDYGCTVCHRGQDRATEFGRAGHVAPNKKMEKRWSKPWPALTASGVLMPWKTLDANRQQRNWDWAANPYLETPMYPRQYYEAGCLKCHAGQMDVEEGSRITKATQMVELYGCHACHKIDNWRFQDLRKPGPSLDGIAEKTTPEWTFRWIANPSHFRSTTRMPSFFYQRNMTDPHAGLSANERAQNTKAQDAEVHAIVTYLFSKSTRRQWSAPGAGDAGRGKQLVESVGCMGCHIAQDSVEENGKARAAKRDDFPLERHYGFNLTGMGTKTHANWIYNWVKNPKAYYANAPMPSLRLTDQEASDITAYLLTLQKPQFMQQPVRPPDARTVRELAKAYLINTMSDRDAERRLNELPLNAQLVYLGQRSIEKYGCYSCHDIKGFEGLKPIGTDLTIEGSKNIHLFDFGLTHDYEAWDGKHEHINHTVPSWIYNKVRSPRVYDDHRNKPYNDKLKMPNFHLTPNEAELITSVVVGLTKERVSANKLAAMDSRDRIVEEGRKLVSQHNCRGCHVVNRQGRAIAPLIADPNFLPPDLSPEGARVQSPWLFNFLKDPTVMQIRPWLAVRMPTFHFDDAEAAQLVSYFAAEGEKPQFDTWSNHEPDPARVAVGRQVFQMLRCQQCHALNPVNPENPPLPDIADTQSLAPNLTLSRIRLRHEWISDWIRRPDEMIPGTRMPTNFPRDPQTGGFQSPLAQAIDTPQFASYKAALLPYFRSEEDLRKTMGDAVALTDFMRDYIWSIGIREMRAARRDGTQLPGTMTDPQRPQGTPPTLPPATQPGRLDVSKPVRTGTTVPAARR
ncbi:MAG TPA: c-type cytochrome [Thermoanaerobaculia bacterium]